MVECPVPGEPNRRTTKRTASFGICKTPKKESLVIKKAEALKEEILDVSETLDDFSSKITERWIKQLNQIISEYQKEKKNT